MKYFLLKIKTTAFLLFLILLISFFVDQTNFERSELLRVSFLDVGQGDATLIETPNGEQVLVDGGRGDIVLNRLTKVMKFYDKKIDTLIISHADLDHIGGFFDVIKTYKVEKVLRSNVSIESKYEEELLETARQYEIEINEIKRGDLLILDSKNNVYIEVLSPGEIDEVKFDRNKNSLVLRLVYGDLEFLLTGDATIFTEKELNNVYGNKIFANVLKVGHHGSKTSTSNVFLEKINPDFAVISYGENSYGHPHKDVVDSLKKLDVEIFETKKDGTIIFETDGKNIEIENLLDKSSIFQGLVSSFFVDGFDSFR